MPKYKYVDGVKYRVVPQSVLGYALVREGSDNSLPAGGTEGQVLSKASNADFDVEWDSVDGEVVFVEITPVLDPPIEVPEGSAVFTTTYTAEEIKQLVDDNKVVYLVIGASEGAIILGKSYLPLSGYTGTGNRLTFKASYTSYSGGLVYASNLEGAELDNTLYFVLTNVFLEPASMNVPSSFVIMANATTVQGATHLELRYPQELDNYIEKGSLGNYALLSFYDDGTRGYASTPSTVYLPCISFDNNDLIMYFGDGEISLNLNTGDITINLT